MNVEFGNFLDISVDFKENAGVQGGGGLVLKLSKRFLSARSEQFVQV